MGIARASTFAETDAVFMRPTERCWFCAEALTGSAWVYWQGNDEHGSQIWLHPKCAIEFGSRLIGDGRKAL